MSEDSCRHTDTAMTASGIEVCPWCYAEDLNRLTAERDRLRVLLRHIRLFLDGPASADWRAKIDAALSATEPQP